MNMKTPKRTVMSMIREAAKVGAVVKFAEQPGFMDPDDPANRHLELRIERPNGKTGKQSMNAIINTYDEFTAEHDTIRALERFIHEVT